MNKVDDKFEKLKEFITTISKYVLVLRSLSYEIHSAGIM